MLARLVLARLMLLRREQWPPPPTWVPHDAPRARDFAGKREHRRNLLCAAFCHMKSKLPDVVSGEQVPINVDVTTAYKLHANGGTRSSDCLNHTGLRQHARLRHPRYSVALIRHLVAFEWQEGVEATLRNHASDRS